jgi:hypothetical protein
VGARDRRRWGVLWGYGSEDTFAVQKLDGGSLTWRGMARWCCGVKCGNTICRSDTQCKRQRLTLHPDT